MDALIGTFHIDWKLVVAQIFNFAVVFVVLYIFALRPLAKLMAERGQTIEKGLKDADTNKTLVEEAKKLYDVELARARKDAQSLTHAMEQEVAKKRTELVVSAEKDAAKILEDGKRKLAEEKEQILQQAESEIAGLVVASVEKILSGSLDESAKKKILEKAIDGMKK